MKEKIKPIRYNLQFCFGSFQGDTAGFESSTPFVPIQVGDFINHRLSQTIMAPSEQLDPDELYRVTAVRHCFQDLGSHFSQYVDVCLAPAKLAR